MIARLAPADAALLHALEAQAQSGTSPQLLNAALEDPNGQVLGYWQATTLVGYAIIARLPFDAELQAIGVLPGAQGQGLGGALLNGVIESAVGWGSEQLLLEVRGGNTRAVQLYRRYGFNDDGRRRGYYPAAQGAAGREDALLMSRSI